MKISTFIMLMLVISGVFFVFTLMSQEAKNYYPEAGIDDSAWANKYDFQETVETQVAPLHAAMGNLSSEETGWWAKFTSGIVALPLAIIHLPVTLFQTFATAGLLVTDAFEILGFPAYLIGIVIVMILVWGIFKLIEVIHRWQL